ncbi:MAG: hypothetical protein RL693_157, partial [Verrucomicrobiota bacterium]
MNLQFPTRRRFITTLTGLSLANIPRFSQAAVRPNTRVIVIGAGVSGLAAANALKNAGLIVTVIEGRNRIGGRIHTDRSTFGVPVEIGAQFIHGQKNGSGNLNPIWDLKLKNNWASIPFAFDPSETRRSGALIDNDDPIWNRYDDFENYALNTLKPQIGATYSMDSALLNYATLKKLTSVQIKELLAVASSELEEDMNTDALNISLKGYDEDRDYSVGGDQILTGGYDQLPKFLASNLTNVRLSEVVSRVDYSMPVCTVTTNKGVYQAEFVLCTLPLGVLQAGSVIFNPVLLSGKRTAIARMGMGCLDK